MFILLRRIERWLHQHIFKVGWLITKNFQTTTILYYTFFLPGVVLQQSIYWLVAGMLNVRGTIEIPFFKREPKPATTTKQAKGAVPLPEKPTQTTIDISKLKPNFVTLDFSGGRRRGAPKGTYRKAIISTMPLLVALVCIWLIATRIFNIMDVVSIMATGTLPDIAQGIGVLTGAPNFWLWIYIVFTLANTMFPPVPDELRGWRIIIVSLVAIGLALTVIGIGGEIFEVLQTPVATLVNVMQIMLILIIAIDVLMVLVLGLIEYTIEHITGHTATFRGDTMEVMTREEALAAREQELEKQRRQEERMLRQRNKAADAGPTSVYMLALPIPGAPNEVGVTPVVEPKPVTKAEPKQPTVTPAASMSAAPVHEKPEDLAARIHIPERKPLVPRQPDIDAVDDEDELQPVGTMTEPITTPFARPAAMLDETVAGEDDVVESNTEEISLSDFMRRPTVETDADEAQDDEMPSRRPVSLTPASRFAIAKPTSDDSEEVDDVDEEPAFSSPVTQDKSDEVADGTDDEAEAEPVAPASSRFGVSPFRGLPAEAEDTQEDETESEDAEDESDEQPVGTVTEPIAAPFVAPFATIPTTDETPEDELDEEAETLDVESAASVSSRFGVSPFRGSSSKTDEDEEAEKRPTVDLSPAKPKGLLNLPTETEEEDAEDESDEQPAASVSSRFGVSPFRGLSSKAEDADEEAEKLPTVDMSPARPKGLLSRPTEDVDEDEGESAEQPAASMRSRFGVSPFIGLSSKVEDGEDADDKGEAAEQEKSPFAGLAPAKPKGLLRSQPEDNDDEKAALSRPLSRTGTTPFASRFQPEEDDENEDDDESMLRRGRGDDAVSSLFGGLGTRDDEDEDDDDEPSPTRSRFGKLGQTPSRFGSRSVIGRSTADDGEYDDDDEEYIDYDDDEDVDYVDDDD